jgi:hypothetical protein
MELSEFLLARIAEDEEVARERADDDFYVMPDTSAFEAVDIGPGWVLAVRPARVLAECEAKRRIVETHPIYPDGDQHDCPGPWPGYQDAPNEPCPTLRILALPYADHPDYRESWRP